jgi:hypothetical protein
MDNRNTPHELDEMFPADKATIHYLKTHDAHFARLAERYHAVNRAVHRMETNVEPAADETIEGERKLRLRLLDEISAIIAVRRANPRA